jgi:hypothetical protein
MTDMIERVAQAIFAKDPESLFTIHQARVYARAAIAAMREPTPAMLEAADAVMLHRPVVEKPDRLSTLTLGFNAMIDAALECSIKPDEK